MSFHSRTTQPSLREVFPTLVIFQLLQQKFVIRTSSLFIDNYFVRLTFTLSASQIFVIKKRGWFSKINKFDRFFHVGAIFGFVSAILFSSTCTDKNSPFFDERTGIPKSEPFPILVPSHDCGRLCRGRRIHKSGHSDFGILSNLGASSIFS